MRYAIVATIELAQGKRENPKLPAWLEKDYFEAIRDLAEIGLKELPKMQDHSSRDTLYRCVAKRRSDLRPISIGILVTGVARLGVCSSGDGKLTNGGC